MWNSHRPGDPPSSLPPTGADENEFKVDVHMAGRNLRLIWRLEQDDDGNDVWRLTRDG